MGGYQVCDLFNLKPASVGQALDHFLYPGKGNHNPVVCRPPVPRLSIEVWY